MTDEQAPPVGEEIHLPGHSLLPVMLAVGITLALVGVTLTPVLVVAGLLVTLVGIWRWVRETRHQIDELPLDDAG